MHDMELDGENGQVKEPDWALLSFQGLLGVLTLAVSVFTKVRKHVHWLGWRRLISIEWNSSTFVMAGYGDGLGFTVVVGFGE